MNIYIGNLSQDTQNGDLSQLFEQYGKVDAVRIIKDHATGKSRGFGFLEMPNDDEAIEAMEHLDGSVFQGNNIRVNKACLLYTSPSPRDRQKARMPSSARKKKKVVMQLVSRAVAIEVGSRQGMCYTSPAE
eukprot:TRINITY_DN6400_c0_g1_i2.p1 TRINITY_DN6400_c0_g1~~TRINITY_DN6400_c0_g1_i2.p1  ORF type:complete len:131 (+),score=16.96 TRINITY_DN6400_c0_g1_i2:134-526(+)